MECESLSETRFAGLSPFGFDQRQDQDESYTISTITDEGFVSNTTRYRM
ncbi:MAG: hypothetical protein JSV10_00960 [Candidatus Zixiibacteriota bacterium]|nr:MAG: hypothetical protein JSV10_00960 [candidate division Zixibacteria bacterium]